MKHQYNFIKNSKYSFQGISYLLKEHSFLLELFFLPFVLFFIVINGYSSTDNVILFFAFMLILIAEGINTAIETVVDLVTIEINPLAKKAKDIGSGVVLICVINFLVIFNYFLYTYFC